MSPPFHNKMGSPLVNSTASSLPAIIATPARTVIIGAAQQRRTAKPASKLTGMNSFSRHCDAYKNDYLKW
jgi:hypothetical protein